MKKLKLFFALFAMLALGVGNAWADVTYVFKDAADNPGNANDWLTADIDSYTSWSATKGGSNNPKYYNTGTGLRVYNGGKFTITSSKTLSSITLTFSGTSYTFQSSNTNTTQTVTPNAKSYEWSVGRTCRLQKIEITYAADAGGETPEPDPDPTPDPEPDPDPAPGTGGTGTINFNSSAVKINAASVTGNDDLGNTWTITTVGTTSYTASNAYYQVGSGSKPATSITFTTTLPSDVNVTAFSAKFGGFNGTAGAVTLKVDDTSVGTGSLNATSDVTISNSSQATGKKLTVTLTGIAKGVKVYYISYTYTTSSGGSEPETPATELTDDQFAWSAATAEATMGASNTFPTLTNTLPVSVTYESSNTAAATIAADGTITLVAPGTTTISAKFAGGEVSGTTYAAKTVTYALTVLKAPATPTDNVYVKVTSTEGITNGEYLIVYEDAANNPQSPVAFDGSLEALDAVGNTLEVTINNNTIAGTNYIDAATFTIDVTNGTILSASGKYIGKTANSNGLDVKTTVMENTFAIDANGNAVITGNTAALRYNKAADQKRFRYYKDGGGSQEKIALYKKASSHTLTYGTCEKGSVSANVADGATVLSGTTITLSNTPATGNKLSAYDVYKTGDNTTKVTVTDGKFIMPEFDVTISATFVPAKTLTSIEITSAATQTTFWQGETFNYTGLEVTAHFDGAADEVVTPTVTGSTATAGTQTVTVSYEEGSTTKTVTYNITVKAIPNTKETAYTIADAFDIIDKLTTADGVFIKGIVSQVDSYNNTYKSITYWISADGTTTKQLQVYSGKGLESADFTAVTDVAKGAQVIVCGNLKKHNTTYEFDYNNYLAAYTAPTKAEPGIAYETTEYTANVNEAFTAPTLTNPNGLAVTYSSSDLTLATVDATTGAVTILDKAGKVTITATFAGNETYLHGTASYNITISDPSISEATFVAATDLGNTTRGEGSIAKSPITFACSDGVLGNASEYRLYQDANITFAAENGYAITKVVLTSTASGDSQYGPAKLSAEDGTYTYSGKEGTWVGEAYTVTLTATAQTRATLITVYYKQDNRVDAGIAWNPATVSLTVGEEFTAPTFSNPNSLTDITFASDNEAVATVNAGVISLVSGKTGTATITATYAGNETYKPAEVKCTISVNPQNIAVLPFAFDGKCADIATTAGMSQEGIDVDDYASSPHLKINTTGDCLIIHFDSEPGALSYTIKANVNSGDFTGGFDVQVSENGDDYEVLVSYTELEKTAAQKTHKLDKNVRYVKFVYTNKVSGQNVALGNILISKLSVLRADLYDGKWGTFCPDQKVTYMQGASFYTLTYLEMKDGMPYKLFFDEITTDYLEAGKPYLFIAESEEIKGVKSGEVVSIASNYNGFYGNVSGNTISLTTTQTEYVADGDVVNNYGVINSRFTLLGDGTNVAHERAHVQIKNGQLDCPNPPASLPALAPGARRVVAGATGINTATGVDQVQGDNVPTKTIINGQLFILRGEKMYDAQGKLVK